MSDSSSAVVTPSDWVRISLPAYCLPAKPFSHLKSLTGLRGCRYLAGIYALQLTLCENWGPFGDDLTTHLKCVQKQLVLRSIKIKLNRTI